MKYHFKINPSIYQSYLTNVMNICTERGLNEDDSRNSNFEQLSKKGKQIWNDLKLGKNVTLYKIQFF